MKIEKVVGYIEIYKEDKFKLKLDAFENFIGTKIKLVAEVEAERKVVRPEGAVWKPDDTFTNGEYLNVNGDSVARICTNEHDLWCYYTRAGCVLNKDTHDIAQRAVEEYLADAELFGFRRELVEEKFDSYLVLWQSSIGGPGSYHTQHSHYAFAQQRKIGLSSILYGVKKVGGITLLKHHDPAEVSDD